MSDQELLAGYVEVWWQAINDFLDLLESRARGAVGHADRPGRLGRARGREPHRAPRGHPRRGARGDGRRRRAAARHRVHGALHRDRCGQPARGQPGRDHQRDPVRGDQAAHRPARGPAHGRGGAAVADLRRRAVELAHPAPQPAPRHLDARAGRPPRDRPARRAWTPCRRGTPPSTSRRASASSSARRSAPRPAPSLVLDMEGSAPFAFAINDAGRGERLPEPPDDPTVTLRMDRESFIRLAGGRCDAEPGAVARRGRPGPRRAVVDRARHHSVSIDRAPAWTPGRWPTSRTRPAGRSWSPARPWAASDTTPRWSSPAAAAGSSSRGAPRPGSTRPRRASATSSRQPTLEQLVVDLSDLGSVRRAAARRRGVRPDRRAGQQRRRDGHGLPADRRRPRAAAWRPTTSARSCSPGCCSRSSSPARPRPW